MAAHHLAKSLTCALNYTNYEVDPIALYALFPVPKKSPEQTLWQMVIYQAYTDLINYPQYLRDNMYINMLRIYYEAAISARNFIFDPEEESDFVVCCNAALPEDAEFFIYKVRAACKDIIVTPPPLSEATTYYQNKLKRKLDFRVT